MVSHYRSHHSVHVPFTQGYMYNKNIITGIIVAKVLYYADRALDDAAKWFANCGCGHFSHFYTAFLSNVIV